MIERITFLTPERADQIGTLGAHFYSLTGLKGEFRGQTFAEFWNVFLKQGQAAMWIYTTEDVIVGTIGMTLTMSLFDGKIIADEAFWFVHPGHRGTAGTRLFFEAKKWAIECGAGRILMGRMLNIENGVEKFFDRQGFKPLQTQYYLDI